MSLKTKMVALTVTALAATASIAFTTASAKAHGVYHGIGEALVGRVIVGSTIGATAPYRRCGRVRQYDFFGRYIGSVNACD